MTIRPARARSHIVESFSLFKGGFIYRLQVWLRLVVHDPKHVWDRILVAIAITWLPLLILSGAEGSLLSQRVKIPLLLDYAADVRFLITLPLLIMAQVVVEQRTKHAVKHFVSSGLVAEKDLTAYEDVIHRTIRLRDSRLVTALLILLAFLPSFWLDSADTSGIGVSTWRGHATGIWKIASSAAGTYAAAISIPVYRLMLFRWIWLIVVWGAFLRRATRLPLRCTPCHPDGAGGLSFVAHTQLFFGIISFAASSVVAAGFANLITYNGASVETLRYEMIAFCVFAVLLSTAPLILVTPRLFAVKEQGLSDYHRLGVRYTRAFDARWTGGEWCGEEQPAAGEEPLLGTSDIQSLADLSNSVTVVRKMKIVLVDRETLVGLAVPTVLPMLVLLASAIPGDQLLKVLLRLAG